MNFQETFQQEYVKDRDHLSFARLNVHSLKQWGEKLLSEGLGDKSQQMFNALVELQQLKIDVFLRLELVQTICPYLQHILQQLEKFIYQNQQVKFNSRSVLIIELFLILRCHYIRLYLQIEQELFSKTQSLVAFFEVFQKIKTRQQYFAVSQILMEQFSLLIFHQQQLHYQSYTMQWCIIHRLYQNILQLGLQNKSLEIKTLGYNLHQQSSLEKLYIHILLFTVLGNNKLSSEDIHHLYRLSLVWNAKLILTTQENEWCRYKINFQQDLAALVNKQVHQETSADYYLDCAELINYLAEYRNQDNLKIDLVFYIQNLLLNTYERKEERFLHQGRLEAYVNYAEIYQFLNKEKLSETQTLLYHIVNYNVDVLDKSKGGYRLLWSDEVPEQLQNGAYLLLREKNEQSSMPWQSAIVRWINHNHEQACELGVEIIGHQQIACHIMSEQGRLDAILMVKNDAKGERYYLAVGTKIEILKILRQVKVDIYLPEHTSSLSVKLLKVELATEHFMLIEIYHDLAKYLIKW